jgi:hypothetical protein
MHRKNNSGKFNSSEERNLNIGAATTVKFILNSAGPPDMEGGSEDG